MQREIGLQFAEDLRGTTETIFPVSRTQSVPNKKDCCPSTGMAEFLREYLPDEFMLTAKGRNVVRGYWHITPTRLASMSTEWKPMGTGCQEAIRLTWPAQTLWDDNYLILPISFSSCHQCIPVPIEGISYQAEIGWISDEGYFVSILTSNWSDCSKNFDRPFPRN
jgi:hypothetical protein